MDDMDEIADKGDQYAKRMLDRKRNQSAENYSKSLRRRLSIMRAIDKSNITSPSNFHFDSHPFKKEFANASENGLGYKYSDEGSPELMQRENSRFGNEFSSQTYHLDLLPSDQEFCSTGDSSVTRNKSPLDTNFNIIEYQQPGQDNSQTEHNLYRSPRKGYQEVGKGTRLSIGEYFGAASHKGELKIQCSSIGENYEDEYEETTERLQNKGRDSLFFEARVLEILEPEVVKIERMSLEPRMSNRRRASDMTFIQETFKGIQLQTPNESITTSLVSEDIRDIDREIDKLQFQPNVVEQKSHQVIEETPKRMYPNLSLVKGMSNNFSPNNLYYINDSEKNNNTSATDFNLNMTGTYFDFEKPSPEKDSFATPMPIPDSQMKKLNHDRQQRTSQRDSSSMSFLKRNASFILNNLHVPKVMRRKPNLESTRKVTNSGGKTISPQIECTVSTLMNTTTSPDFYDPIEKPHQGQQQQQKQQMHTSHMQNNMNATIPFEVENFLELALGDERYNSTITYANSDARDRTNSHINASELISEEIIPNTKEVRRGMREPLKDNQKHSKTLNRTLSIYKTLTQRIKKKFRGSIRDEAKAQEDIIPYDVNPQLRDDVKKLLDNVELQQTQIYQASKALEVCNSNKEFISSSERVESERFLVLASLRKKAAIEEIRRMISQNVEHKSCRELAVINLKEFSLPLREDVLRRERQNGDIVEWFIIVASEGRNVWSTHAVACPISSPRLYFSSELSFSDIKPDFRLTLKVYSLKLQQILYNHEDKYHISQNLASGKTSSCPVTKKLLSKTWGGRQKKNKRPAISPKQFEIKMSGIKESSFVLCGSVEFSLHDLSLSSPWPLIGVPTNSVLQGTIDLNLSCKLQLSILHAGFLTHGDEAGGLASWNRRWCVLEGHTILFWNYPREQECKLPLYTIDLVNCVSRHIGLIDRSLCAKARTLLIETVRRRNAVDKDSIVVECRSTCTVVRNLLSCDTNQDLTEWQSKLNHVVSALREWNIIDIKSSPEVSDL